nr:MAG TPA_asm: hypothetical protein [Caudoviricetes sp.]
MITILKKVIKSNQSKNATSRINTEKLMLCARVRVPLLASFQTRFVSGIRWKTCLFYFKKCLFLRHEIGIMGADKENKNKG